MEQVTVLNIGWEQFDLNTKEGKFSLKEIESKKGNDDYGIYQIYGYHPVYGSDTLLYIGKAEGRTFSQRITGDDRSETFFGTCCRPTSIRLGKLLQHDDDNQPLGWEKKDWEKMINIAERLLIRGHAPALNKKDNTGVFDANGIENKHYLILNWNDYGQLLPEVSSFRRSYKYWDFDTYISVES